jgi:hypothetical protein
MATKVRRPYQATEALLRRSPSACVLHCGSGALPSRALPRMRSLPGQRWKVTVRLLPAGGAVFLTSLIAGERLCEAAADAFAKAPSFDLTGSIAGMTEAGVFATIRDAMRYLRADGKIGWKPTQLMLDRLADAERDAIDDLEHHDP